MHVGYTPVIIQPIPDPFFKLIPSIIPTSLALRLAWPWILSIDVSMHQSIGITLARKFPLFIESIHYEYEYDIDQCSWNLIRSSSSEDSLGYWLGSPLPFIQPKEIPSLNISLIQEIGLTYDDSQFRRASTTLEERIQKNQEILLYRKKKPKASHISNSLVLPIPSSNTIMMMPQVAPTHTEPLIILNLPKEWKIDTSDLALFNWEHYARLQQFMRYLISHQSEYFNGLLSMSRIVNANDTVEIVEFVKDKWANERIQERYQYLHILARQCGLWDTYTVLLLMLYTEFHTQLLPRRQWPKDISHIDTSVINTFGIQSQIIAVPSIRVFLNTPFAQVAKNQRYKSMTNNLLSMKTIINEMKSPTMKSTMNKESSSYPSYTQLKYHPIHGTNPAHLMLLLSYHWVDRIFLHLIEAETPINYRLHGIPFTSDIMKRFEYNENETLTLDIIDNAHYAQQDANSPLDPMELIPTLSRERLTRIALPDRLNAYENHVPALIYLLYCAYPSEMEKTHTYPSLKRWKMSISYIVARQSEDEFTRGLQGDIDHEIVRQFLAVYLIQNALYKDTWSPISPGINLYYAGQMACLEFCHWLERHYHRRVPWAQLERFYYHYQMKIHSSTHGWRINTLIRSTLTPTPLLNDAFQGDTQLLNLWKLALGLNIQGIPPPSPIIPIPLNPPSLSAMEITNAVHNELQSTQPIDTSLPILTFPSAIDKDDPILPSYQSQLDTLTDFILHISQNVLTKIDIDFLFDKFGCGQPWDSSPTSS